MRLNEGFSPVRSEELEEQYPEWTAHCSHLLPHADYGHPNLLSVKRFQAIAWLHPGNCVSRR